MTSKIQKKILIITSGNWDHSSTRIRIAQFIPELENQNLKICWIPRVPKEPINLISKLFFPFSKRILYIKTRIYIFLFKWDLLFAQRAYLEESYLKRLREKKTKIIYDFDDALYLQENDRNKSTSKAGLMIQNSDKVIISTPYLISFCEENGKNPIIVPTSVDGDVFLPKNHTKNDIPIVGWIGSLTTTIVLKAAEEGLKRLSKKLKFKLILIGADPAYQPEGIFFEHLPWSLEKEPSYLNMMDVGIMPLPLTEYSKGKGGFKIFLYMATAIPSVVTPIGINSEIIIEGVNGYLASNDEEWETKLYNLLTNAELRNELGTRARKIFDENYSKKIIFKQLNAIIHECLNS